MITSFGLSPLQIIIGEHIDHECKSLQANAETYEDIYDIIAHKKVINV